MNKQILIITFLFGSLLCTAQELHTPAQILSIMENSDVSYSLEVLEKKIALPNFSESLNAHDSYRVTEGEQMRTFKFASTPELSKLSEEAEAYFQQSNIKEARKTYLKMLDLDSTQYGVMTYIGQTYGIEKNFKKAEEWYKKTIKLNYIDYMAHWFLADVYRVKGELEAAADEITIARILNRNNPRIKKAMDDIYKLNKLKVKDFYFNPQYDLDSSEGKISVKFGKDWLGYAIVKALWRYEPGYAVKMGGSPYLFSTYQEKEALIGVLSVMDKKKQKKYPEFKAMQLALDAKMLNEYILFEILLPYYPHTVYQLSEETIIGIKDYVLAIRGQKKMDN